MCQHLEIVERSSANKRTRVPLEAADLLLREAISPAEAAQAFLESCVRDGNSDLDRNVADIAHRGEERLVRVLQAGSEASESGDTGRDHAIAELRSARDDDAETETAENQAVVAVDGVQSWSARTQREQESTSSND